MKIAVIAPTEFDFKDFVKDTGVDESLRESFMRVSSDYDIAGRIFAFVLETPRAYRMINYERLKWLCLTRVYVPPPNYGNTLKFNCPI